MNGPVCPCKPIDSSGLKMIFLYGLTKHMQRFVIVNTSKIRIGKAEPALLINVIAYKKIVITTAINYKWRFAQRQFL